MERLSSLNRRCFMVSSGALIGTELLLSQKVNAQSPGLSVSQHPSLMLALESADQNFDEDVHMIRGSVSGVGYHTTLQSGTVHHTRSSLQYAAALMASGEDWRIKRAKKIIKKVVSLQDQNPENKTYGIWSWYLEEPLEKMSPPDWNWADFCSVQLLKVWLDYQDHLDDELNALIKDSIIHAAHSIQRRNVGPGYTNIAMMGTYVTVTVGERMNESEIHEYGKERLRRVHKFTMDNGSFQEYNSSTYSVVAIAEITRMMMHFQNKEDRALANDMHNLAWKHLATHFHAPTRQLSGPQSRCYSTDLRKRESTLAFLELATGNTGNLLDKNPLPLGLDHSMLDISCPDEYRELFFHLDEPREVVEVFKKESNPERKDIVGTTYLHPLYTLGSINHGDFWVQRRPILAYWGTPDKPTYLQVRFLKDGYDFSSAIPITVQNKNRLLSIVTFATDYGDTHISLDKVKDATIKAKDLRLRFEIGGDTSTIVNLAKEEKDFPHYKTDAGVHIKVSHMQGYFNKESITVQTHEDGLSKDVVCFSSTTEQSIRLDQLDRSFIVFGLEITHENEKENNSSMNADINDKNKISTFHFSWNHQPNGLSLQAPIYPTKLRSIYDNYKVL